MRGLAVLPGLVENETLKVLRRRRFRVVVIALVAVISLVVFAQHRKDRRARDEGRSDWRARVERRAAEMERRGADRRVPEAFARFLRFEAGRLRYHLGKGIDPDAKTGPLFCRGFAGVGSVLLLPLLVAVFASDLVSSEVSEGTIKLLLTRPVARWKVLLGKLVAMGLFTTLTVALAALASWAIAGAAFGFAGWGAPVLTGFRLGDGGFDASAARAVPLWQDALAAWGLAWYASLAVGAITTLLSVLFRSAAAAMGTMLATLVTGTILSRVASDWEAARWLFVTCLPIADYYAGMPTPVPGMSLGFCTAVLGAWAVGAAAVAFAVFGWRDVGG